VGLFIAPGFYQTSVAVDNPKMLPYCGAPIHQNRDYSRSLCRISGR
jgi:hypothetical protein